MKLTYDDKYLERKRKRKIMNNITVTDRINDIHTGEEYYVTRIDHGGVFGRHINKEDKNTPEIRLLGEFKLTSSINGEYTTPEQVKEDRIRAQEIIKLK